MQFVFCVFVHGTQDTPIEHHKVTSNQHDELEPVFAAHNNYTVWAASLDRFSRHNANGCRPVICQPCASNVFVCAAFVLAGIDIVYIHFDTRLVGPVWY